MATTANRDAEVIVASEADGVDDVCSIDALGDEPRMPIDHSVVDFTGFVVFRIVWCHNTAAKRREKLVYTFHTVAPGYPLFSGDPA
jgi:hypothetical protein